MSSLSCFILLPLYVQRLGWHRGGDRPRPGHVQRRRHRLPAPRSASGSTGSAAASSCRSAWCCSSSPRPRFVVTQLDPPARRAPRRPGAGLLGVLRRELHARGGARAGGAPGLGARHLRRVRASSAPRSRPWRARSSCASLGFQLALRCSPCSSPPSPRLPRVPTCAASGRRAWGRGPGLDSLRRGPGGHVHLHMALTFFFGLGTGAMFTFLPTFGERLGVHSLSLFYTAYAIAAVAGARGRRQPHRHARAPRDHHSLHVRPGGRRGRPARVALLVRRT